MIFRLSSQRSVTSGHIVASIAQYTLNCDLTVARWLGLGTRASNECLRRFHNHGEDPFWGFLLVERFLKLPVGYDLFASHFHIYFYLLCLGTLLA